MQHIFGNKNVNNMKTTSDYEVKYGMKYSDDEEGMRAGFNIESLVEECFSQMQEGFEKHDN